MEQNYNHKGLSPNIKKIVFVNENGDEQHLKADLVFGCAITRDDGHCETFILGKLPGGAAELIFNMAESNAHLINAVVKGRQEDYETMMKALMEMIGYKLFNGADGAIEK